jgi:hypothetical protein
MAGPIKLFRTIPQTLEQTVTNVFGTLPTRVDASLTFPSLASGAEGTDIIQLAPSFRIVGISVGGKKCRVRLYSTSALRAADASRSLVAPPTPGTKHGVILDLYLDQVKYLDPWVCSPEAGGSNMDSPSSSTIYVALRNYDTVTQSITLLVTYIPTEATS